MSAPTFHSLREATDAVKAGCQEFNYDGEEPLSGTIIDVDEPNRLCLVKYDLLDGMSFTTWRKEGDILSADDGTPVLFTAQ